jgi:aminoglycoside phosphotransferase (APT) family kinase protein
MTETGHLAEHRALTARLFPNLAPLDPFVPLRHGWTSFTYLAGGTWVVQFPRGEAAAPSMRRQLILLAGLQGELSAPIPDLAFASHDPLAMAYRRIAGVPFPDADEDGVWPERLGRFLYDLHLVPPEYVGFRSYGAPAVRAARAELLASMRERVFPFLNAAERSRFALRFDEHLGQDEYWRFAPCLVHNDLGPEHVLVAASADLAGVIDWEDAEVGDPADDFAFLLHAHPGAGERALAAYGGPPDRSFRERARFIFFLMPWHEVIYGLDSGQDAFVASGLVGVRERADA